MENFIIGPMTPWGPFATGFVGLLCAFVLYGLIMKYPAGKGDVVKIGDQIHLGAKVFMITEYKILTPVVIALVVACGLSPLGWYTATAVAVYHPSGERPHATTRAITTGVRILYSVIMKTFAPR